MGSTPSIYDITKENLEICERNILMQSGLPEDQIQAKHILVGKHNNINISIRTIIFGDETKPVLVFVHGYA